MDENRGVRAIGLDAGRRVGRLAAEFVGAESDRKEAVLAELEFFRWLQDACEDCLENDPFGPSSESAPGPHK
jgi:hypothetical protein